MTAALVGYSATFMRYALAVSPKNYLLFGCHVVNFSAQTVQSYRYINYWHMGGRDAAAAAKTRAGELVDGAKEGAQRVEGKVVRAVEDAKSKVQGN